MATLRRKEQRHKDIVVRIVKEAGEEGLRGSEIYEEYADAVNNGHPLTFDGESPITRRHFNKWLLRMCREDRLHRMMETMPGGGRGYVYWHPENISVPEHFKRGHNNGGERD